MTSLRESKDKIFSFIVILVDILLINLGFYIPFMIKFNFSPPEINIVPYIEIIPFITIAALLYFDLYGLLAVFRKSLYETLYSIFFAVVLLSITTMAITYFNQGFSFPRSILLMAPVIQISLLTLWRIFVWETKKFVLDTRKVAVIGSTLEEVTNIVEKIRGSASNMLLDIKYSCDTSDIDNVLRYIDLADEVFVCSSVSNRDRVKIIGYCINKGKGIYIIPDLSEILLYKSHMLQFDDVPTFAVENLKLSSGQRYMKRGFDIAVSLVGTVILLPIMAIVAASIKLNSKGTAIYSQERVTREGKTFKLYKFRTMVEDAEKKTGPVMSVEGDNRVTQVGNILRKLRLDEIPQLFNVLTGAMSIVGPRPERPHFVEQFKKEIPGYEYRTSVKAGITGLAQVLGKYTTIPEDKLRYDLLYIRNYSILFDIKIILQTLKVAFMGQSSEGFNKYVNENLEKAPVGNIVGN